MLIAYLPYTARNAFFNSHFEADLQALQVEKRAECAACDLDGRDKSFLLTLHHPLAKETHTLGGLSDSSTLKELQVEIWAHAPIPTEKQRIFVRGQEIIGPNDITLAQLKIHHEDHLLLALRNMLAEEENKISPEAPSDSATVTLAPTVIERSTPGVGDLVGKESLFSDVAFILEDDDHVIFAHKVHTFRSVDA